MIAKKMEGIVLLCIALLFCSSVASGAPFLPGEIQLLEDEDVEILLDSNGSIKTINYATTINTGDLFGGVVKIQRTENKPSGDNSVDLQSSPDTFTSIFLLETLTTSTGDGSINGSYDTLSFGPAGLSSWESVYGSGGVLDISPYIDFNDLDGSGTGISAGTMALMFDGVSFADADPYDSSLANSAGSYVNGAQLLYEFGFTGSDETAAAHEFWTTIGIDAEFPSLVGTNNPTNRLSLNITQRWAGPELIAHNYLRNASPYDTNFTGPAQLQGKGDFAGTAANEWPLGTDTDLYINAVPEPTTMFLFGTGLLGMAAFGRKRFMKKG